MSAYVVGDKPSDVSYHWTQMRSEPNELEFFYQCRKRRMTTWEAFGLTTSAICPRPGHYSATRTLWWVKATAIWLTWASTFLIVTGTQPADNEHRPRPNFRSSKLANSTRSRFHRPLPISTLFTWSNPSISQRHSSHRKIRQHKPLSLIWCRLVTKRWLSHLRSDPSNDHRHFPQRTLRWAIWRSEFKLTLNQSFWRESATESVSLSTQQASQKTKSISNPIWRLPDAWIRRCLFSAFSSNRSKSICSSIGVWLIHFTPDQDDQEHRSLATWGLDDHKRNSLKSVRTRQTKNIQLRPLRRVLSKPRTKSRLEQFLRFHWRRNRKIFSTSIWTRTSRPIMDWTSVATWRQSFQA